MSKIFISNPPNTTPPFYFGEAISSLEGKAYNLQSMLDNFEPMDVLSGAIQIFDSKGQRIALNVDDGRVIEENQYPKDFKGITAILAAEAPQQMPDSLETLQSLD